MAVPTTATAAVGTRYFCDAASENRAAAAYRDALQRGGHPHASRQERTLNALDSERRYSDVLDHANTSIGELTYWIERVGNLYQVKMRCKDGSVTEVSRALSNRTRVERILERLESAK